ncbi:sigma-70 family RNA polymerase sigma factor [Nocardioides deserti]|uniref:Sigma-70 family RNA polymerase sigma factor n=1 Tax=Nocardioides deserti TaxID=1588644 RepID=A0ABR6U7X7_9ACTN|nr:sigma-70 family RNA polymerase sigma factor [Nocardioides deserti]MBC2960526.1 sigma-70 family RNA polymerase sigma factor [Nocardioides deserti]GGO71118.1 DNA-directed RNA polymerase sigma-70 factor [Nocardioides deserti]
MEQTAAFEDERPRLVRLAARILADGGEAEDVVQQAWLRLHGSGQKVRDLPAWLTTVTTRLCLDRLRAKVPVPEDPLDLLDDPGGEADDPADRVALADTVGVALQLVLDRLSPGERVAFVLHDSFGYDFATVATILDTSPAAARKLASRARAKVVRATPEDAPAAWEVVDAFLTAARGGDLRRLLDLLAPEAVVVGDRAAVAAGTPERITGREAVAAMFDGAAKAALPMYVDGRPGAAWVHRGETRVAFDFTVVDGRVARIDLRAEPELLASVRPRRGAAPAGGGTRG